jgi:hypothetical protein
MKQHKWHKEIKAWADGAEIEVKTISDSDWKLDDAPFWWVEDYQFRIKPKHTYEMKHHLLPRYLYIWERQGETVFTTHPYIDMHTYIGKVKLEIEE